MPTSSDPSQSRSEFDWPHDRCAECDTTEGISTPDVTQHPPLCGPCAELWYGPHPENDDGDCRAVAS